MADNVGYIWTKLKQQGMSDHGAAGLLGNMRAESGWQPNNLQNSYSDKFGLSDSEYTEQVSNGTYRYKDYDNARDSFTYDKAGYGLVQWTYWSLKRDLYDWVIPKYGNIGSLQGQTEFLLNELATKYPSVYNTLMTATDVKTASNKVLLEFERPASKDSPETQRTRAKYSAEVYNQYSGKTLSAAEMSQLESTEVVYDDSGLSQVYSYQNQDISAIIDPQKLKPFVAYVTDPNITINYDWLKAARVCTVMFDAGSLFDSAHLKVGYKTEGLYSQVISAAKVDFPFGLFVHSKAKNIEEAKEEAKAIERIIYKYPPPMGLWIHPKFVVSHTKSANDKILEFFFIKCVKWGLRGACGLYCTKSELDKISWSDNFKDKYFLWYVNHGEGDISENFGNRVMIPDDFFVS